ncbi:MAG: hypothetical protein HMLKMBBP_03257 [Planctomycetes bacterium]|nr:hypothetical protein [Planctomycetota bacterium]
MQTPRRIVAIALAWSVACSVLSCAAPRPAAVPGCPRCGDPVTVRGADGRGVVVTRLRFPRLPEAPALPVFATGSASR